MNKTIHLIDNGILLHNNVGVFTSSFLFFRFTEHLVSLNVHKLLKFIAW